MKYPKNTRTHHNRNPMDSGSPYTKATLFQESNGAMKYAKYHRRLEPRVNGAKISGPTINANARYHGSLLSASSMTSL